MTATRVDDAELHVHLNGATIACRNLDARRKRSARAMEARSVIAERVDSTPDEHISAGWSPASLTADQRGDLSCLYVSTVSVAIDWKSSP